MSFFVFLSLLLLCYLYLFNLFFAHFAICFLLCIAMYFLQFLIALMPYVSVSERGEKSPTTFDWCNARNRIHHKSVPKVIHKHIHPHQNELTTERGSVKKSCVEMLCFVSFCSNCVRLFCTNNIIRCVIFFIFYL